MIWKRNSIYLFGLLLFFMQSCNYNYYRGEQLEEKKRYEEANIEYHRAYTSDPDDTYFKEAYERTAKLTVQELIERYQGYLKEKQHTRAFNRLEHAHRLDPQNEYLNTELKKWVRILLAGKAEFHFRTLKKELRLADEMKLMVLLNTPDPRIKLEAEINQQDNTFAIEDILYDPPPNLLMFYTINKIGVKTVQSQLNVVRAAEGKEGEKTRTSRVSSRGASQNDFVSFINLRTPVLSKITGDLDLARKGGLKSVGENYPIQLLQQSESSKEWIPKGGLRYSLKLDGKEIHVESSTGKIDFIPQMLYLNIQKNQRIFVDFGHLVVRQSSLGGSLWSFRRKITADRTYYQDLNKNLILKPYLYYLEGGYPFILAQKEGK